MRTLFPRASCIAAARSTLVILLVGLASAAMAQVPAVDWKAERAEILRHYRALVQIDTSNPPGNETLVANYLKGVFEAAGIPVKTFALEPARANLVARIKGNGSKRPVLIGAHRCRRRAAREMAGWRSALRSCWHGSCWRSCSMSIPPARNHHEPMRINACQLIPSRRRRTE